MKRIHLKRTAVAAGMIGAALGAMLLLPTAASAHVQGPGGQGVGTEPGHMHLVPASGDQSTTPSWNTDTACPTGEQVGAFPVAIDDTGFGQQIGSAVSGPFTVNPMTGDPFIGNMGAILNIPLGTEPPTLPDTWEFGVVCQTDLQGDGPVVMSTFVTYKADGTWTSSATPPGGGTQVTTTTSLAASPLTALQGSMVTLTATVTGAGAAGNVEFLNGTDSLGTSPVSNGTASLQTSTLPVGDNVITAKFTPTDPTAFTSSTSPAKTVTILPNNGDTGTEQINVNVPLSEGVFTLTVSPTAVQLTQAVNQGTFFESTGTLSPVTVSDGRIQSKPGWSVSGQVSDFTGPSTIDGNSLGWTPQITTPNAANDVVAGSAVAAGANPGLKQGSGLASAAAAKGLGSTVLGAGLDLQVPTDTAPGNYSATLTVTALESAS